jgi:sugar (pentulose or hexulose) kinase
VTGEVLLGVDAGTTSCKVAVVSASDGHELAIGHAETPWERVETGAELDPRALLDAVIRASRDALGQVAAPRVRGVGVTSMAETGVLLDGSGDPVTRAIAWHDRRSQEAALELAAEVGRRLFVVTTGLAPTHVPTITKLRWLERSRPGILRAGRRWLSVAEWIVHGLGGRPVAELSLASRTGLLDRDRRAWSDGLAAWCGAPVDLLPELVGAGEPAGEVGGVLPEAAGAVLTVAGHDHLCAAVGVGATRLDDVLDSTGSAEAFLRAVAPPIEPERVVAAVELGINVGWHVLPDRYAVMGGFPAGLGLLRVLRLLGVREDERQELEDAAAGIGMPSLRLAGLIEERASLLDIGWNPSRAEVWRAAVEEVVSLDARMLERIEQVAGPRGRLVVAGGWSRSPTLMAVKRARLGDLERPDVREPGALGAALLAGRAAGIGPLA